MAVLELQDRVQIIIVMEEYQKLYHEPQNHSCVNVYCDESRARGLGVMTSP